MSGGFVLGKPIEIRAIPFPISSPHSERLIEAGKAAMEARQSGDKGRIDEASKVVSDVESSVRAELGVPHFRPEFLPVLPPIRL